MKFISGSRWLSHVGTAGFFFFFALTAAATTSIVAKHSGKCIDVPNYSTTQSTQLQQFHCKGNSAQTFEIVASGAYYLIKNINSNLCLNISGSSTADGGKLIQWACGNYANEQFTLKKDAGGYYSLLARNSGKCVGVPQSSTADGALLFQYTCSGIDSQRWTLTIPAATPAPTPAPTPTPTVAPTPTPGPLVSRLRVASFNLKHGNAGTAVQSQLIAGQFPDVVSVQECPSAAYLSSLAAAVGQRTGDTWYSKFDGYGTGLMSRIPFRATELRSLGHNSWTSTGRWATRAEISVGGQIVEIWAVHLDIARDWSGGFVLENMQNLMVWMSESRFAGYRRIAAGDFNSNLSSSDTLMRQAQSLIRQYGYFDSLVEAYGSNSAVPNTNDGGWRPDAIFRSSGLRTVTARVIQAGTASDHNLLWADLDLN